MLQPFPKKRTSRSFIHYKKYLLIYLDMLGDASSNIHMQYLREGVLMTEVEENKLNQTTLIKVRALIYFYSIYTPEIE